MLTLRPYQKEARAAVRSAYKSGKRKLIVAHATGTGKTVLFSRIIKKRGGRALVLAHRQELILQAEQKLRDVGLESIGIVKAERREFDCDVTVASVQTLINHLPELMALGAFRTVVCDEAHHFLSPTYKTILEAVTGPETLVLGVTATPFRTNKNEGLGDIFEEIIHGYPLKQAIEDGYLCKIKAKSIKLKDANFKKLKTIGGEITESSAAAMLFDCKGPEQIAAAIHKYAPERSTLVFAPTVEAAEAIEQEIGSSVASVFGHTPSAERSRILSDFSQGKILRVVNCGVLTEGYDEARVSCVALTRPTKSPILFEQCIGRGTRLHPDKENLLLLDFVGASHRHDLVNLHTILPKTVPIEERASFLSSDGDQEEDSTSDPLLPASTVLSATTINLFEQRPFAWVKTTFGYVLDCGGREIGHLTMLPTAIGWDVRHLRGDLNTSHWHGASFAYAQAHAEAYAKFLGAASLARRNASWRSNPISDGQIDALRKWGCAYSPSWTKGRASDELTRAVSEARHRKSLR